MNFVLFLHQYCLTLAWLKSCPASHEQIVECFLTSKNMIAIINRSVDSNLSCLARWQSPLQARQVSTASWPLPQVLR